VRSAVQTGTVKEKLSSSGKTKILMLVFPSVFKENSEEPRSALRKMAGKVTSVPKTFTLLGIHCLWQAVFCLTAVTQRLVKFMDRFKRYYGIAETT
jgi:hypothetical protein